MNIRVEFSIECSQCDKTAFYDLTEDNTEAINLYDEEDNAIDYFKNHGWHRDESDEDQWQCSTACKEQYNA